MLQTYSFSSRLISRCSKEQKVKYLNTSRAKRLVHLANFPIPLKMHNRKFLCFFFVRLFLFCRRNSTLHYKSHTKCYLIRSPKVHKCFFLFLLFITIKYFASKNKNNGKKIPKNISNCNEPTRWLNVS